MANYGLIKSFGIDSGELDGLRRKDCFVLGYELALIDGLLKYESKPIAQLVHASNRERVEQSCKDAGRPFKLSWMQADPSEDWMMLHVDGIQNENASSPPVNE